MKRVLSILAAMVMILAAVTTLGEDLDPIVGTWFTYYIGADYQTGMLLIFDTASNINMIMLDVGESGYNSSSLHSMPAGKWSRIADNIYVISGTMLDFSRTVSYLDGDLIYLPTNSGYMAFRRITQFDGPKQVFTDDEVLELFKH